MGVSRCCHSLSLWKPVEERPFQGRVRGVNFSGALAPEVAPIQCISRNVLLQRVLLNM